MPIPIIENKSINYIKRLVLPFLLILVLILSGCVKDGVNASETDLSSYPEGVQNGTVSVEYYEEVMIFHKEYLGYRDAVEGLLELEEEFPAAVTESDHVELFATALKSFNHSLSSFNFKPKTVGDKKIAEWVEKVVFLQQDFNEAMLEQVVNGDRSNDAATSTKMSLAGRVFEGFEVSMNEHQLLSEAK